MGARITQSIKIEKEKSPFIRVGDGVFGLREWNREQVSQSVLVGDSDKDEEKITEFKFDIPRAWVSRPKYYVILLSTIDNLKICRDCNVAGFPDTDNGRWAFLDIEVGDYISFYHSYHLYDLYQVKDKQIPKYYASRKALGIEGEDPVPICNGVRWKAIPTSNGYLYFPYRLDLQQIEQIDFNPLSVFKPKFVHLGANLIPRGSLRKTHFQIPVETISSIFDERDYDNQPISGPGLKWFIETEKRERNNNISGIKTFNDIIRKEIYLQAMMKKMLEALWDNVSKTLDMKEDVEHFSEQSVVGGEADLVIKGKSSSLMVEIKRESMYKITKRLGFALTSKGDEAVKQIQGYSPLWKTDDLRYAILGINQNNDGKITVLKLENELVIVELDGNTSLF